MGILAWVFTPVMDLFWQVMACEGSDDWQPPPDSSSDD